MTGQDLLDRMELLNSELQLQSGEANVTKGLVALNVAQDHFEALIAGIANCLGDASEISTTANAEKVTRPTGMLRIDRIHTLTGTGGTSNGELTRLHRVGGHAVVNRWPWNVLGSSSSTGKPTHYWTDGTRIWFYPTPDAIYHLRLHGLIAGTTITAAGTFVYPDSVALPIALFATKLFKMGLDDPTQDIDGLAGQVFGPVISQLSTINRDGANGLEYTTIHHT